MILHERKDGEETTSEAGTWYYHADHLGSSSVVTDRDGEFYEQIEYFPYGETWVHNKSSEEMTGVPYKFTGKEYDPETGFIYFGARYYDARLARWTTVDPILYAYLDGKPAGGVYEPSNLDLFGYVSNNPILYIDPNGQHKFLSGIQGQRNLRYGMTESFNYTGNALTFTRNNDGSLSFGSINLWQRGENGKPYELDLSTKPISVLAVSARVDKDGKQDHFAMEIEITKIAEHQKDDRTTAGKIGDPVGFYAGRKIYGKSYELDKDGNRLKDSKGNDIVKEDFSVSGKYISREGDGAAGTNTINFVTGVKEDGTSHHGKLMEAAIKHYELKDGANK
jgi:RHS repeat-associated protein